MGKDEYNSLEDLVFSRSFRNWVLDGDTPEAGFWVSWQDQNPDKLELIHHAKAIIYALQLQIRPLSEEAVDMEIVKVLEKLRDGRISLPREIPYRPAILSSRPARAWTLAAAAAGVCIFAWSLRLYLHRQPDVFHSFLAVNTSTPMRQQTGSADSTHLLTLPDGSRVRLSPGSKLYYPQGLFTASHRREMFLDGSAFFDVTHDAAHPFYVYTNSIITKVLGTSFQVRTTGTGAHTVVIVSTGKVSVYRKSDFYARGRAGESGGIILTPNQQIAYDPAEDRLDKALATDPKTLPGAEDSALVFDRTPLSVVFHRLQALYGIPILYDEEALSSRTLSVTMGDETFFVKLNIICKAINASYETIDGTIVITINSTQNHPPHE